MTVLKRDRKSSASDLVQALDKLIPLLASQNEDEAIKALTAAAEKLRKAESGSKDEREAVEAIVDAFEGEHELMAYTFQRDSNQWTEAEELSHASSRVITLARRIK